MFEEFYEKYESEEHDVIALMGRCIGYGNDPHCLCSFPQVLMLGVLFKDSGKIESRTMRLNWPVWWKDLHTDKGKFRFTPEQVCRLKIRKIKDEFADQLNGQQYCLSRVIRKHVPCPELNRVLDEYHKEVVLQDDVLGACKLDKDLEMFESDVDWCGIPIRLTFDVDAFAQETWNEALDAAKSVVLNSESWDHQMREFAAAELIEDTNAYLAIEQYESGYRPLSEEDLANKLYLELFDIFRDGKFRAYFGFEGMLEDYEIIINGSIYDGIEDASLEVR